MRNPINIILLLFTLTLFTCADIIVPDITEGKVSLFAPTDSLQTSVQNQLFKWDALEFADGYNLEIVSPSFDSIVRFELDSNTTSNSFQHTLTEGQYEWKVTPYNEAYEAMQSEIYNLQILSDDEDNLAIQSISLFVPEAELCTNETSLDFVWNELAGADIYIIEIADEDFSTIYTREEITSNQISIDIEDDGIYYWRVRGENQSLLTFTPWTTRRFTIDRTAPLAPELIIPANNSDIVLDDMASDNFQWSSDIESIADSLFIYQDLLRDTLLYATELTEFSYDLEDSNLTFPSDENEDYYWQVRSVDKTGNVSELSDLRVFYIIQ